MSGGGGQEARGAGRRVKAGRRPPKGPGLDEAIDPADAAAGLAGRAFSASKPEGKGRVALAMHPDPRSGCDERSSQRSDELLSVPAVLTRHPMRHAHKVRWQTPVTGAPHLSGRSPCSDPPTLRARRPLIMMMRSMPKRVCGTQVWPQAVAGLSVAPAGISPCSR